MSVALPMPSSRRARFRPPRRTGHNMQVVTTRDENDGDLSFVQVDEVESNELMTERWTLQSIASELWTTDYEQLFNIEIERATPGAPDDSFRAIRNIIAVCEKVPSTAEVPIPSDRDGVVGKYAVPRASPAREPLHEHDAVLSP